MKSLLILFFTVQILSFKVLAYDGIVYVISGGPFNTGPSPDSNYQKYLDKVHAAVGEQQLYLKTRHNSEENVICSEILAAKQDSPNATIILSGHSYGADAAVNVSRCLQQKNIVVDLLLTADTVARQAPVTKSLTIPENVRLNFHYYQRHDAMIKGSGFNKRADGSSRSIYNFRQNFGTGAVKPHLAIYTQLIGRDIHSTLAAAGLHHDSENQIIDVLRPLNDAFFKDFPLLPLRFRKKLSQVY